MQLPTVSGSNLSRQKRTFPADFANELNLVFIAFQQWQQSDVDTWIPMAESLSQTVPVIDYYEFPTIQQMNVFARTFINEGMRAGITDDDIRARTVTLYLDKETFRQSLDISEEREIWIYLFNKTGQVLWRASGPYTPEKGKALQDAISDVRRMAPSP